MIHPPPRRRRAGTAARQQWKTPLRLVSITARQSSSDCAARSSPKRPIPALLTRMSSPPKRCSARSITRCAWSASRTSASTVSISPADSAAGAAAGACSAARASAAGERPQITTRLPCATSAAATAAPMPRDPPVTTATRPASVAEGSISARSENPRRTETGQAPGRQGVTSEHIRRYVSEEQRSSGGMHGRSNAAGLSLRADNSPLE